LPLPVIPAKAGTHFDFAVARHPREGGDPVTLVLKQDNGNSKMDPSFRWDDERKVPAFTA
jgi:hypothetical protein